MSSITDALKAKHPEATGDTIAEVLKTIHPEATGDTIADVIKTMEAGGGGAHRRFKLKKRTSMLSENLSLPFFALAHGGTIDGKYTMHVMMNNRSYSVTVSSLTNGFGHGSNSSYLPFDSATGDVKDEEQDAIFEILFEIPEDAEQYYAIFLEEV